MNKSKNKSTLKEWMPCAYAGFVTRNYVTLILLVIFITLLLGLQIRHVQIEPLDYKEFLPDYIDTMEGIDFIENTFMSIDNVWVLIKVKPGEEVDWTEPQMYEFVDRVEKHFKTMPLAKHTNSYASTLKQMNNGSLKMSRAKAKELMEKEEFIKPQDPLKEAKGFVKGSEQISAGVSRQQSAIEDLTESSGEILESIEKIKANVAHLQYETAQISSQQLDLSDLRDGLFNLRGGLTELSSNIEELNKLSKDRYCEESIYDPVYGDQTQIPNPYYNETACAAYSEVTPRDSYVDLMNTYCEDGGEFENQTRCARYEKILDSGEVDEKDYSIYEGFSQMEGEVENDLVPAVDELIAGIERTQRGIKELEEGFVELDESLQGLLYSLSELEEGMEKYHDNMLMLKNQTKELDEKTESFHKEVSLVYEAVDESFEFDHKKKRFWFSNKDMFSRFFSKDKSATVIPITLEPGVDRDYVSERVNDLIGSVEEPKNVELSVAGDFLRFNELMGMIPDEMSTTSIYAGIFIILIIMIMFRRPFVNIFTLSTIIFGTIWTFGILGLIEMPLNPASAGVLSLLFGIGIDFGIQIFNEFKGHFFDSKKGIKDSLEETFRITFRPILITTGAAVLGFFAMGLGEVSVMKEMGMILMIGAPLYCVSALFVLPSLLVFYAKITRGGEL